MNVEDAWRKIYDLLMEFFGNFIFHWKNVEKFDVIFKNFPAKSLLDHERLLDFPVKELRLFDIFYCYYQILIDNLAAHIGSIH